VNRSCARPDRLRQGYGDPPKLYAEAEGRAEAAIARCGIGPSLRLGRAVAVALLSCTACIERPVDNPNIIVVSTINAPNNLDPRVGTDEVSGKIAQVIFSTLADLDDRLRVVPGGITERIDNPDPKSYIFALRRGVYFHDGHELTADDVVYTFRSLLDPNFISPKKGAFGAVKSVDAIDRYTVEFTLKEPFASFLVNLFAVGIIPAGSGASVRERPIGTGPYKFVRYAVDDHVELAAFEQYFGGRPQNDGIIVKIMPDDIMRGLELRTGAVDLVINDIAPDIVHQLRQEKQLQTIDAPGLDYQYIGLNMRDPILTDVRVRQAFAHAIDRQAIVEHLRRGLARPADALIPSVSWAYTPDVHTFPYDPGRARALLDQAGYPDPDGDGPLPRLRLRLKASNAEYYRLQAAVIQQDLRRVGVALDVRTYEFATLYADVLSGNFQMVTMQWIGGAVADPDILYRIFHSSQIPPAGFNRGHFSNPHVDAMLDRARRSTDQAERLELFAEVQRVVAQEVPYISLWHRRNVAVAQRTLTGLRLTPIADYLFLKDVARVRSAAAN
jgi:peptide/nickel transport system substrate-binding protein